MDTITEQYIKSNSAFWEFITPLHINSEYYRAQLKTIKRGKPVIDSITMNNLKDVCGKNIVHPLCHLGYETISFQMLGAHSVTGLDFNQHAIKHARSIASYLKIANCRFERAELYNIRNNLNEVFDLIYISYGSLCWIPNLNDFFKCISSILCRNAEILIVDFHPFLFCSNFLQSSVLSNNYFDNTSNPIKIIRSGSYALPDESHLTISYNWNHSVRSIINSLIIAGFNISSYEEYPFLTHHNGFSNLEKRSNGFYYAKHNYKSMPLMLCIKGVFIGI